MLSTAIFVYAATSPVNGYFGGSLYARQGGNRFCFLKNIIILLQLLQLHHIKEILGEDISISSQCFCWLYLLQ